MAEQEFLNYARDDGGNVSVPRRLRTRRNAPEVELAYITPEEAGILSALKPGTPHRGPMEIPNYDSFDAAGNYTSGAAMSAAESSGPQNERMRADLRSHGISPQQAAEIRGGAQAAAAMGQRSGGNFFGNIARGVGSIFGGVPGTIASWASRLDPRKLRGMNPTTGEYYTQDEYETNRANRIANKRIQNILNRDAPITDMTIQNLNKLGYTGEMPGLGSTRTSRAIDKDYTMEDTLREHPITSNRISEIQNAQGWNNELVDVDKVRQMINNSYDRNVTSGPVDDDVMQRFSFADFGIDPNATNNFNNKTAWVKDTPQDKLLKSLFEMKSTYGDTPAYQKNLQKDWDNYKKTGEPLSLPKKEYSGVEGYASLNDPYAGIQDYRAEQLTLPGMQHMPSGYPWSVQGTGASPNSWITKVAQGGRVGYNTGGRVGILAAF